MRQLFRSFFTNENWPSQLRCLSCKTIVYIIYITILSSVCSGCVSISPYPKDWPARKISQEECIDISGTYALPEKRPHVVLHMYFEEKAESLKIIQYGCHSIRFLSLTGSKEIISEKTFSLKAAGPEEVQIQPPPEASFIVGLSAYGYTASIDTDGALLVQSRSYAVGLVLFVAPILVIRNNEWIKYKRQVVGFSV